MDDAIRKALEVASLAACDGAFDRPCSHPSLCADAGRCLNDMKREEYAAAIAAFHDHMADQANSADEAIMHLKIAVAIRRAAGG